MAVQAILLCWRVLPQKWTALVSVALEAGVIDGVRAKHLLRLRPVGIVTIAALNHFSPQFISEQVRRTLRLGFSLVRMTSEASLAFRTSDQQALSRFCMMDAVTRQAPNLRYFMSATLPESPVRLIAVAGKASLGGFGRIKFCRIGDFRGISRFRVRRDITVAGSATLISLYTEAVCLAVSRQQILFDDFLMAVGTLPGDARL